MVQTTSRDASNGFDQRAFRKALGRFATGIAVITTRTPAGKREGLTVNSFSALSLAPPLVLWSLNRRALSLASFRASNHFAVSVLGSHQRDLSSHFARPAEDKFEHVACDTGMGGCPTLPNCLAVFECQKETTVDGGDHVLFIGRVERFSDRAGAPLVFSGGQYCVAAALPDDVKTEIPVSEFADLLL